MVSSGRDGKILLRRSNIILSSVPRSTEHLHLSFLVGDSWEGGTVILVFILSQLGLQLQI